MLKGFIKLEIQGIDRQQTTFVAWV